MLQRLLYGRYGFDHLSAALLVLSALLSGVGRLTGLIVLWWCGRLLVVPVVLRALSRQTERRRAENLRFLELMRPWRQWLVQRLLQSRDREHKYFTCPQCGRQLRVPRGKGKISITCTRCHTRFEGKS